MAIERNQIDFITRSKKAAYDMTELYGNLYELFELFTEKFASSQSYSIDPDNQGSIATTDADLLEYGINYTDFAVAMNQGFSGFINFWTNKAVTTRERGKDIRAISSIRD